MLAVSLTFHVDLAAYPIIGHVTPWLIDDKGFIII